MNKGLSRWSSIIVILLLHQTAYAQLATATVEKTVMPLERWFDGTVAAVNQATVSAETSARVQELLFDVGDNVPAGAVILRLVSTEQREHLNQSEASLAEANSVLAVETRNYERSKELLDRQLIPQSEFDQAGGRLNASRARVASAEAALQTARQRLSYTEVRAPYGGIVSARHVEIGEAVNPGTPLMSGFDPAVMRVEVDVPQAVAVQVREQQTARIISADNIEIIPAGIILFPVADPATSTIRVRLELPHHSSGLYPGQFVKVAFTTGNTERLLVPASSVVYRSEVTGLYVLDGKSLHLRQVRTGSRFGDQVEILAGLNTGEMIALDPVSAGIMSAARSSGND
jgi:RND family efflux transporter MFP subunit